MKRTNDSWNIGRLLRLLLGAGAVVQGVVQYETVLIIAGIVVLLGAVFNAGCCGRAGCAIPPSKNRKGYAEKSIHEHE